SFGKERFSTAHFSSHNNRFSCQVFFARKKYSSRTGSRVLYFSPVEFLCCLVLPFAMIYAAESEFQIPAHRRAAGSLAFPRALRPRPRIPLVAYHSFAEQLHTSEASPGAAAPRILIVTPRLEFSATVRKQKLWSISNRNKMAFSSLHRLHQRIAAWPS